MKRPKWYNPVNFIDMIVRFNPFGFKESDGTTCAFKDYGAVYDYTLEKLFSQFPRGEIDMTLFIQDQCKVPFNVAYDTAKALGFADDDTVVTIIPFENTQKNRNALMSLFVKLHSISGTSFNKSYFDNAYNKLNFDNLYERAIK